MVVSGMGVTDRNGTPELRDQYSKRSGSNAADLVCFGDDCFSLFALVGDRPIGLVGAN